MLRRVLKKVLDRALPKGEPSHGVRPGDPVKVSFGPAGGGEVPAGITLLEASRKLRVDLDSFCGGNCSCSTCRVMVRAGASNLSPRSMDEEITLGAEAVSRGDRLACQARVMGPVELAVPEFFGAIG